MMVWSINLFVLSIGILSVGMIKPNWIMFWQEKPARFPIFILSALLFMIAATMFGQANFDKKREKAKHTQQINQTEKDTLPSVAVEQVKEVKGTELAKEVIEEK